MVRFAGVVLDITDRKRVEEELRAHLVVTDTVTTNAAEALYLLDTEGRCTYANPTAEEMFGWTRQEMLGRKLHDLIHYKHPDGTHFPMDDCAVGQCFASWRTLRNHEDAFVHKDGSLVPVLCSMAPIHPDGRSAGAVLAVSDITERKQAEAALRESEGLLSAILENVPVLQPMSQTIDRLLAPALRSMNAFFFSNDESP